MSERPAEAYWTSAHRRLGVALIGASACLTLAAGPSIGAAGESSDHDSGYYSTDQAKRGKSLYDSACGDCHSLTEFKGEDFEWRWRRQTALELFQVISETMPEDKPGKLPKTEYADIVAYFLELNDYEAGGADLSADETALSAVPLGAGAAKSRASE